MSNTINFCGDSFCASQGEDSWTTILARLLGYKICGRGKKGSAYEHAIKTFDSTATATVFCWTETHRIYHPKESLNFGTVEEKRHNCKIHAAAHEYYKYLHTFDQDFERKQRDFFWFDEKVLKRYRGKLVHLFSFPSAVYSFKHGKVIRRPLSLAKAGPTRLYPNHLTKENNVKLANSLYELLA